MTHTVRHGDGRRSEKMRSVDQSELQFVTNSGPRGFLLENEMGPVAAIETQLVGENWKSRVDKRYKANANIYRHLSMSEVMTMAAAISLIFLFIAIDCFFST